MFAFFSIYDNLKESGPQYVYVNQEARQLEMQNAKARADKKKKEQEEKKKKQEEEKKKKEQDKKEKNDKNKAGTDWDLVFFEFVIIFCTFWYIL